MPDIIDLTEYQEQREIVKEYYANLLILQYRNKEKARETIKTSADLYLCDGLVFQLQDILDIDKAQGHQLDIIGKILDVPRIVQGINVNRRFFQFHVDENSVGFSRIGFPQSGSFKSISNYNLSEYSLPDYDYRILLKYKAVYNVMRGSTRDMDEALNSVFGTNVLYTNNQDLTMTYILASDSVLAIEAAQKLGYFRTPIGVNVNYIIAVPTPGAIFGFNIYPDIYPDIIDNTVAGFSTDPNNPKEATWLKSNNIIY